MARVAILVIWCLIPFADVLPRASLLSCYNATGWGRLSPKSFELVKSRLEQKGIIKQVNHRKDKPKLYKQDQTYKQTLFGIQEGKCNGCQVLFPFRNMTVDYIVAKSKGGTDAPDNLQLLCGACSLMREIAHRTADSKFKNEGILQ